MIDSHIHADSRSSEDFEKMFLSGIDTAISCCYYPYKIANESVLINHMMRILNFDTERCEKYGLNLKIALGIHPTNSLKSNNKIFKLLEQLIDENFTIGLTVQPQKMDVEEAIAILTSYEYDDFLLNSDISNKPSDPLSVPKTIRSMEKIDLKKKNIDKIAFANAKKFFNI
jgi:predicted metal-dependent TIM-barrel fold hydrolase